MAPNKRSAENVRCPSKGIQFSLLRTDSRRSEVPTGGEQETELCAIPPWLPCRRARMPLTDILETLAREFDAFVDALFSPNRIVDKVEEMGDLASRSQRH